MMPVRHIVLLQFNQEATADSIASCMSAFAELPGKIDGIIEFESGQNTSPEGLSKGFTHAVIVTFSTAATRDAYIDHPGHLAFIATLKPLLSDVLVVDFEI